MMKVGDLVQEKSLWCNGSTEGCRQTYVIVGAKLPTFYLIIGVNDNGEPTNTQIDRYWLEKYFEIIA